MGIRWNSPLAQVIAVGFICFCSPGMFNALNSLSGGGQIDSKVGQNANFALYTCFAIFGLLAGAIHNKLGPKWTIFLGCATYVLYVGSLLCYNHTRNGAFTIAAGGLLGVGAGILWTAQGAIMMAYPREHDKGKYIGYFWAIFNAGAVLGSVIAFAINNKVVVAQSLGDSTYIVFTSLMVIGALIALSLCPPTSVAHANGDKIQIQEFPAWTGEVVAVMKLFLDWRMIFSTVNGAYFSTSTQSLNNIFYWFSQIGGSWTFARVLDYQGVNRKSRSLWGLMIITAFFVSTWVGGIFFQKSYTAAVAKGHDYTEGASASSPPVQPSHGESTPSVPPFMTELIICFALLVASLPGAFFLTMRIKDYSDDVASEHDMKNIDGKLEVSA
ncbi:hypothetical protein BGX29_003213 [Mortierella sp. GBA35]|nr:hypothetical protein BGX29_003213 [Mortierella sp. GBA35]